MAELYAASMAAHRVTNGRADFYHSVGYCVADSEAEALGFALMTCRRVYPEHQGFRGHNVAVGPIPRHVYPPEHSGG